MSPARGRDRPEAAARAGPGAGAVLACLPLDDRPVTAQLPQLVGAVAGATVLTPPAGAVVAPGQWLASVATPPQPGPAPRPPVDAAVVSLERLTSGGLVASRTGTEPLAVLLEQAVPLRQLAEAGVPVHAAVLVPRAPDTDDDSEEPAYWRRHGRALHALSVALQRQDGASREDRQAERARAAVPAAVRRDWLARRLRQHQLALHALALAQAGVLDTLVVGVDDTTADSLSVGAAADLSRWAATLELGDRVLVGHGADEAGAVLVGRALLTLAGGAPPAVGVDCAVPGGLDRVADYEADPVGATAAHQLRAAGAVPVGGGPVAGGPVASGSGSEPAAIVVVHPPYGAGDWALRPPTATDSAPADACAALVTEHLAAGRVVAVADVAQPNGADPALVAALARAGVLPRLAGWAAWNTAGNTLGSVAAALVATLAGHRLGSLDDTARQHLLASRLAEDYAWSSIVRARVRRRLAGGLPGDPSRHDQVRPDHPVLAEAASDVERVLTQLPGLAGWHLGPRGLRLPWGRTFEAELDLRQPAATGSASSGGDRAV